MGELEFCVSKKVDLGKITSFHTRKLHGETRSGNKKSPLEGDDLRTQGMGE